MDLMELQQMRYVVAVAELGSFTRAAERCFVVQSALSHQVARLEEDDAARLRDDAPDTGSKDSADGTEATGDGDA